MELYLEIAGNQIDGARDYQEDAFLTTFLDDEEGGANSAALIIMADGMGGHAAGNIASNLVVSTFNKSFTGSFGTDSVLDNLRASLDKANDALAASVRETPALDGMGCTLVSASIRRGRLRWTSVGDSHLYLLRDKELSKINDDHSYGGYLDRMKSQGMEISAEAGLSRNMLMSAMTGQEIAEIDCPDKPTQLLAGDRLIIASDGLDTLSAGTISQMSAWSPNTRECVDALLKAVEDAGKPRQDNTTVIVIDVLDRGTTAATASTAGHGTAASGEPDHEATQPIRLDELVAEAEVEEVDFQAAAEPAGPGMNKAMAGAIAAVVVLGVGAAAYYMLGVGEKPATTIPAQTVSQPTPEKIVSPMPKPEPPAAVVEVPKAVKKVLKVAPKPREIVPEEPRAVATAIPAREFRDRLASGGQGPQMVNIPAGSFEMGSGGLSTAVEERPRHTVRLPAFAMSKYEITFAEYARFATATKRPLPDNLALDKETHPVVFTSWDDAHYYGKWLSRETGKRYRLPTEAEWEYAAAGGSETPYWWGFEFKQKMAHCFGCGTEFDPRKPTRVGRFMANPFGLYDTAGNVSEWVQDCYHLNYQNAPVDGSKWEGGECSYRISRGGSYDSPPKSLRHAKRTRLKAVNVYSNVGIRLVRER